MKPSLQETPVKGIITHTGRAHEDDTIAVAVALHLYPDAWMERVYQPTPEQLADPSILVIDVGGSHDPSLGNYDHHQIELDRNDPESNDCAATLFFKQLYKDNYDDILEIHAWLTPLAIRDNLGTRSLANWAGCHSVRTVLGMCTSPTAMFWTNMMSQVNTRLNPGDIQHQMLRMLGDDIHGNTSKILHRLDLLENGAARIMTTRGATINIVNVPYEQEPALGLNIWLSRQKRKGRGNYPKIDLTIYPSKVPGKISVHDPASGNARFQLRNLEGMEDIEFVHKGGFLAAFTHNDIDRVLDTLFEYADRNEPQ